jgi:predicted nucleic acid-binding protein
MRFLDTNILLYAISANPQEARKRQVATAVIEPLDWACSAQVLQEFYVNATRASAGGISAQAAAILVERFAPRALASTDAPLVQRAIQISQRHQISYWDAAIVAAALRCGAKELLTEDLNAGQVIEGVAVVNPFGL